MVWTSPEQRQGTCLQKDAEVGPARWETTEEIHGGVRGRDVCVKKRMQRRESGGGRKS